MRELEKLMDRLQKASEMTWHYRNKINNSDDISKVEVYKERLEEVKEEVEETKENIREEFRNA